MKKLVNIALVASMMITAMQFTAPVQAFTAPEMNFKEKRNYSLKGSASASKSPISYWGPDKLNDGIINRDANKPEQSRWSSEAGAPGWIKIDLKEEKTFKEFLCAFETKVTRKFHIDVSNDDKEYKTIYTSADETAGHPLDTHVTLDQEVSARYVKLTVDSLINGAYPSVSMYEFEIIGEESFENLALSSHAESDYTEGYGFTADKTIDNSFDKKSRWSSDHRGTNTLTYTYDEAITLASLILEWERCNAVSYHIQVLKDGAWVNVKDLTTPKQFSERINLDEPVETTGVRIVIDSFFNKASNRDGEEIDYGTVSLYEVGMYDKALSIEPEKQITAAEIANELVVDELTAEDTSLTMPEVPEGFEISFIGADYEQIVAHDMTISKPLTTQNVTVNFEVSKTTKEEDGNEVVDKAISPAIVVTVPGMYDAAASINEKPAVLPELQQWMGKEGNFEITDESRIVVDPAAAEFMDSAEAFAADYLDVLGKDIAVVSGTDPQAGDFYFTKSEEPLDEETYIMDIGNYVSVSASYDTGAYWSTRTILQILKQSETTIAKGIVKDYPKYEVRGFMIDVARRPFKLDFLQDLVKTMSWYKLNNLHVHLNDNCFGKLEDGKTPDYSGFRIESDVPNLTSTDYYYTKDEFRDFIKSSKEVGVGIVPEFDSPGHSGAFVRARPDLARSDSNEYLDVENPEAIEFIKSVFAEYTSGDDPVFPKGTVVHVGTDEYKRGNKEAFRKFQDDLLRFIRDEQGYTPRVWGSQTENSGTTPITVDGIQMNLWYAGYANPREMYEKGYDCINTNDGDLYIVPGAGYYFDYLDQSRIAGAWQPNKIGNYVIPVGDEQMLGSTFAVWNDKTGPANDNGTSDVEVFDRIFHIAPTFAAKLWGDINDYSVQDINKLTEKTGYAPNSNPTYEVESIDSDVLDYNFNNDKGLDRSGNDYHINDQVNVTYEAGKNQNALTLHGGESYVQTPLEDLGLNSTMEFWVKRDADSTDEEQILFESEEGAIKAVQKETGKFGFSRQWHDYSFNYELPKNEWVKIRLDSTFTMTKLYVNDELTDTLGREHTGGKWASLIMPLERIGSKTMAFQGQIDDLLISREAQTDKVTATSEQPSDAAKNAIDGNPSTMWHTKWDGSDKLPQSITLEMPKAVEIDGFNYLPRQSGTNGMILRYSIEVSEDGKEFTEVAAGNWERNASEKTLSFAPCKARFVRLVAYEGVNGFASAAEISVNKAGPNVDQLEKLIRRAGRLNKEDYTSDSWNALEGILAEAMAMVDNKEATQAEVDALCASLDAAMENLIEAEAISLDELITEYQKCSDLEKETYTKDSWAAMDAAIKQAEAVLEAEMPSADAISQAITALMDANAGLVERAHAASIDILQKSVEELIALRENYTETEFADAEKVIEAVNAILAKDPANISASEVKDAVLQIAQVKDELSHNDYLNALRVICEQADKILASDEINDVRPGKAAALKDARKAAQDLIDANSSDEAAIAAASNNLHVAIQELYKIIDTSTLAALIQDAEKMNEASYTPDSWNHLTSALAGASSVIENKDATVEEVQNAYDTLLGAISGLEINKDRSALKYQLDLAKQMLAHKDAYVSSSIKGLAAVVNAAEAVYQNEGATQEEIDTATEQLIVEMTKARLKADKHVLEEAILYVERLDLNLYEEASIQALNEVYTRALDMMQDETATQEQINALAEELHQAAANLVKKENNETGPSQDQKEPNEGAATGDSTGSAGFLLFTMLSGAALIVMKKREKSKLER